MLTRLHVALFACLAAFTASGCALGPRLLERSHGQYNEAVKETAEQQLLLNIVRLRYNDNATRLDVSAIAAQYEMDVSAEARPFFAADGGLGFSRMLPFVGAAWANRPTLSLTPIDDSDTIRGMFTPSTLDGIIFLSETSWPVSTVFKLWVGYLNRLENASAASGPPRGIEPELVEFHRAAELLQALQDRGDLRFVREERIKEIGSPLAEVTATAQVEAAKNGYEYQQRPDKSWVLIQRDRRLVLTIDPEGMNSAEGKELYRLLNLKAGQTRFEVSVGGPEAAGLPKEGQDEAERVNVYPRSLVQALFYLSHGVQAPLHHLEAGVAAPAQPALTAGLFTVHSAKQHRRPSHASVAVKYRDCWFYIDDRDTDSKVTFSLMMVMTRANIIGQRRGGPALTLPVGR